MRSLSNLQIKDLEKDIYFKKKKLGKIIDFSLTARANWSCL